MPCTSSITGLCDGPMPSVNPGRPIPATTDAARLTCSTGWLVYVCSTEVPSSMVVVALPAIAMATSGSPPMALAYQRLVKPSASARSACTTIFSTVPAPPVSPMRIARTYLDGT